jgi:hypothetical protein
MLLNEFMYFNDNQAEMTDAGRYDPAHDSGVIKSSDLRKSRLTLKMLNNLRKAGDAREREQKEELALVRTMYATPVEGNVQ